MIKQSYINSRNEYNLPYYRHLLREPLRSIFCFDELHTPDVVYYDPKTKIVSIVKFLVKEELATNDYGRFAVYLYIDWANILFDIDYEMCVNCLIAYDDGKKYHIKGKIIV